MRKSNKLDTLRFSPEFEFNTHYAKETIKDKFLEQNIQWDVKRDYSISQGWEVCPLSTNILSGQAGYKECEHVATFLKEEFNASQSAKTGFHIHWNLIKDDGQGVMTPKQLTNIIIDWYNFKRIIELILPESRRGDHQTNLTGITRNYCQQLIDSAKDIGENDSSKLQNFINYNARSNRTDDIRISSNHNTIEFRKAIFTVDHVKLNLWIEFTRNLIGYNMKARQKNFRKINQSPDQRLSVVSDKGLEWSFRQVWEYRAGNLGLLEVAERRALQLARGDSSRQEAIRGITERIKSKYNR